MKIAIASGKGGTGKTTTAVNLAYVASQEGYDIAYADADVEEPNGHIFLKPKITDSEAVNLLIPEVDMGKCIGCGKCAEICQYGAITYVGDNVQIFPQLCHGCGGCYLVCPTGAIKEIPKNVGVIEWGQTHLSAGRSTFPFYQGRLNIGEVTTTRVIEQLLKKTSNLSRLLFVDAAPGTSCPVVKVTMDADLILLVTEPTPFGMSDLHLAVEVIRKLRKPMAVFINRSDIGNLSELERYLKTQRIPIYGRLSHSEEIAKLYSGGLLIAEHLDWVYSAFHELLAKLIRGKTL